MIEGWIGKSKRLSYVIITPAQKQSLMDIFSSNFYIYIKLGGLFLEVIWENRFTTKNNAISRHLIPIGVKITGEYIHIVNIDI